MSGSGKKGKRRHKPEDLSKTDMARSRRAALKKLGRFATVTAPTVTLLLAAQAKPNAAQAASSCSQCQISSSRRLKTSGERVDATAVLCGVAKLAVERWRYKPETGLDQAAHIGPYAEDFRAAFGIGDGVTINTIDALGVCLAAIKVLSERVAALEGDLAAARERA